MKTVVSAIGLLLGLEISFANPLENLGFDDANTNAISGSPGFLSGSTQDLLPGWSVFSGNRPVTFVDLDVLPAGRDLAILYSTNIYTSPSGLRPPIEGRFSLTLFPAYDFNISRSVPFSIEQVGEIPRGSSATHFLGFWDGRFNLTLNGTEIPLVYVPRGTVATPTFDVYGDVSAFAGQNVDFRLNTKSTDNRDLWYGIDSVSFIVPEPPALALMALGFSALLVCCPPLSFKPSRKYR